MIEATTILILIFYIYLGVKKPGIALITSPIVTVALLSVAIALDSAFAASLAPMILLATFLTIFLSESGQSKVEWPYIWAKLIVKCAFIIAVSIILLVMSMLVLPMAVYGLFLFVFFVALVIGYSITSRKALVTDIVSTIGASMRQNLPLTSALESAAERTHDKRSQILRQIANWLTQGFSLSESIKRGYPRCPGHVVAMIAMAERIDQLPMAIKSLEMDMLEKTSETAKVRPVHPLYPVIVLSVMFFVLLGTMTYIIPKFKNIFEDLGVNLPASTKVLIDIMGVSHGWITGLFALLVLVVFPMWLYMKFRPRRPERPRMFSRMGDFLKWHLPILHWFEVNYSLAQTVECLRLSLNAGCTVDRAIDNTLGLDVNLCFRRRLTNWFEKVSQGDDVATAARQNGIGNTLAWAFDSQVNQGNTPAILEMLADFYRSHYSYMVNLARFVAWPCLMLLIALLVGLTVYALFSPLVEVINQMASSVIP
jgi:type II secretory pathway component PulF